MEASGEPQFISAGRSETEVAVSAQSQAVLSRQWQHFRAQVGLGLWRLLQLAASCFFGGHRERGTGLGEEGTGVKGTGPLFLASFLSLPSLSSRFWVACRPTPSVGSQPAACHHVSQSSPSFRMSWFYRIPEGE